MAKFDSGKSSTEDVSGNSQSFNVQGQPVRTGLQTRKVALENSANHGNATSSLGPSSPQKPVHPKPPLAAKPPTDDKKEKYPKPSYLKPVAQRFGVQLQATNRENDGNAGSAKPPTKAFTKEEPKPLHPKPAGNKFLKSASHEKEKNPLGTKPNSNFAPQESEANPAVSKVATVKEKFMSAMKENEPKPPFFKKPVAQKLSLNLEVSHNEDTSNKNVLQKGPPGPRANTHSSKAAKEMDENSKCAAEAAGSNFSNVVLKPTGYRTSSFQGIPKNVEEKTEEKMMCTAKNIFLKKTVQEESGGSSSSCTFHKMKTVHAAGESSGGHQDENRISGIPKRKALLPLFKLGQPPKKPSRPPSVDLEKFQKGVPKDGAQNEGLKQIAPSSAARPRSVLKPHPATQLPTLPRASRPSLQPVAAPSLPPRNIKPSSETISPENEENYDDVEFVSQGHGNTEGGQESDGEMYEDINDFRSSRRKEKKQDKEEKRRMDQEKKEQKEKEKKEQEIRKKFKLTGPIQVLHQARACADYKGGKNELTVKQGDEIEIIRLTDNPEGKWLGRIKGCYGYIKTVMVEIDYDSLKKQQPSTRAAVKHSESDQEVYDDVGEQDTISSQSGGQSGAGKMFPPPPSDQEIYDGIDDEDAVTRSVSQDEDKNDIWSWGILKRLKVKDVKKKSVREKATKVNGAEDNGDLLMSPSTKEFGKDCGDDVYDDVDSSDFPPPPPELNSPKSASLGKCNSDEKDTQKRKKIEREEKEFRKKFKFEGEIKVLYSTTTVQDLPQRRWGSKELQVKPGESLEIIESTDDTKVLCRNEDGKYGYVRRSILVENEGEIYDDIGDDCIYDND